MFSLNNTYPYVLGIIILPDRRILAVRKNKDTSIAYSEWECSISVMVRDEDYMSYILRDAIESTIIAKIYSGLGINASDSSSIVPSMNLQMTKTSTKDLYIKVYQFIRNGKFALSMYDEAMAMDFDSLMVRLDDSQERLAFSAVTENAFKYLHRTGWRP